MGKELKFGFVLLIAIFIIGLVSAVPDFYGNSNTIVQSIQDFLSPFVAVLFGGFGNQFLFESLLYFLIILSFSYIVLSRIEVFKRNAAATWIITISVSLLATRFTGDYVWTKFILISYNVLGVSLLSIIPFIIFLFFIESFDSGAVRKFGWALYICVYVAVWYSESDSLGDIANIYLFAAIIGLILLLFDKTVRGWMARRLVRQGLNANVAARIADLQEKIDKDIARLGNLSGSAKVSLNKRIDDNIETMKKISKELRV